MWMETPKIVATTCSHVGVLVTVTGVIHVEVVEMGLLTRHNLRHHLYIDGGSLFST